MNKFTERYKNYDSKELFQILANSEDYQPAAVEAATIEIAVRELSASQISEINSEIESEKNKKKFTLINLDNIVEEAADFMRPVQEGQVTSEKRIKTIALGFTILCIYTLSSQYYLLKYIFRGNNVEFDFTMVVTMLQLLILFVGTILFWTKEKKGLYLLVFHCVFIVISCVCITVALITMGFASDYSFFKIIISIAIYSAAILSMSNKIVLETFQTEINSFKKVILIMSICSIIIVFLTTL